MNKVGPNTFPRQSGRVGKKVLVVLGNEFDNLLPGTVVRDDTEQPYVGIVKLDDGRYVLMSECQFEDQ